MRFPDLELDQTPDELPVVPPEVLNTLDAVRAIEFLGQLQEPYRAALSLFYMEDNSYKEIAEVLEIPLGTVRSRISRGIAQLQEFILAGAGPASLRTRPQSRATGPGSQEIK